MPLLLLLLLTLACLPVQWPALALHLGSDRQMALVSSGLTWLLVVLLAAVAAGLARRTRRLLANSALSREAVLQRYGRYRTYHLLAVFLAFGIMLARLGWGWTVRFWCMLEDSQNLFPGAELLTLAPFLASLVLSWACFYDAERAFHDSKLRSLDDTGSGPLPAPSLSLVRRPEESGPFWSRWAYVGFHLRHHLALLLAPLLLIIGQRLLEQLGNWEADWQFVAASLTLVAGVVIISPLIFRLVLGLKPLPEGPLRTRLLTAAARMRFRCSNLLVWHTRGGVVNAMLVGVLPRLRYVVFTDRLLSDLEPEEVEAVLGHEIGHARHHHMLYYFGFGLISVAVVAGLWTTFWVHALNLGQRFAPDLLPALHDPIDWKLVSLVPFLAVYLFVVFGFLSRRCERQADIFGCRTVSCGRPTCLGHDEAVASGKDLCPTGIHTFICALEKVARLNGISRSRPGWLQSWQHSTIARRVDFLYQMLGDPTVEPQFQQRLGRVKWGLLLGLAGLLVFFGTTQGWTAVLTR
jgi:STE24 endopeptidase